MSFAIFKLVYSLIGLSLIGVHFLYQKMSPNFARNLFYKRSGIICSKCSTRTIDDEDLTDEILNRQNSPQMCLSCRRDSRLNQLMNLSYFKDSFDNWVLTKRSEINMLVFIFIPFPFIVLSIFLGNKTFSDFSSLFNSTMLIIYWSIMIYRVYLCRK